MNPTESTPAQEKNRASRVLAWLVFFVILLNIVILFWALGFTQGKAESAPRLETPTRVSQ